MYFVDRNKIETILSYMEHLVQQQNVEDTESLVSQLYLERVTHVTIETIIDVGNLLIDGFIMRDPGSYQDIIDILVDEQVLPSNEQEAYTSFIRLRKSLVQDYLHINHKQILELWRHHQEMLTAFPAHVRQYLDHELGPISAFGKKPD
ncbi:DUF86 domain-containing protein [Thalassobacillus sp. CUG 92003]|uniref:DUF86 domain-containing protein n=1 Tax=Thalassobacillus sp. CUG 92003 TaxID=2736641 RepID=UPI0015E7A27F|nr:DUF86 domain-containing protein [Thalassobacillus sp. CUG 92003]